MRIFLIVLLTLTVCSSRSATVHYVDANGATPVSPYTNWATAATVIQDAIEAAISGDTVLVTNGIYTTGGRLGRGAGLTNRVVLDKAVTLKSVNGPLATAIQGYQVPGTTNGPSAVRCAYMTNGATLIGFTLTNGGTLGSSGDAKTTQDGGGIYCDSTACAVSNCVLIGNCAYFWGGGANSGTFNNCSFIHNSAESGGGVYFANLNNCLLVSNSVSFQGGGAVRGTLNNCTIIGNSAATGGGFSGSSDGIVNNSIIYYNSGTTGSNYYQGSAYNYCCTTPASGSSITNPPQFVDQPGGNFRLQPNSRCINAGNNTYAVGTDLNFNTRIAGGTVDIGAFEFAGQATGLFTTWLQQYQLPTNGSADLVDSDDDGHNNVQEWLAGTVPTNALSVLKLSAVTNAPSGPVLTWQSVLGRTYLVQRTEVIGAQPAFVTIRSNIGAAGTTTSLIDTDANNPASGFYRVGVQ